MRCKYSGSHLNDIGFGISIVDCHCPRMGVDLVYLGKLKIACVLPF